ncbi:MAG: TIR domain-containing protein [Candidatus Sulfotelmatobacter sp.]
MGAIFISYRRSDSQGEAGRLFDDLVQHFGEGMVFMDVAVIEAGRDFRKAIEKSIAQTLFCVAGFCSSKAFRSVEV